MRSELEKIKDVREKSQEIGAFLEWLFGTKDYHIGEYLSEEGELVHVRINMEELLAEYFEIDLVKAEKEREKILEDIREKQPGADKRDFSKIIQKARGQGKPEEKEPEIPPGAPRM